MAIAVVDTVDVIPSAAVGEMVPFGMSCSVIVVTAADMAEMAAVVVDMVRMVQHKNAHTQDSDNHQEVTAVLHKDLRKIGFLCNNFRRRALRVHQTGC